MKTLIHSKDFSITDIMLEVQKAAREEYFEHFEVKVGHGTYKIRTAECATVFSLGIAAYIDAKEERDNWKEKALKTHDN